MRLGDRCGARRPKAKAGAFAKGSLSWPHSSWPPLNAPSTLSDGP